jgi:hypothetical protein
MLKHLKLFNLTLANSKLIMDEALKTNARGLISLAIKIKSALRIIHKFHINKKRIIFVGNPLHINMRLSRLFRKTKHVFIPRLAWTAGHMTNRFSSNKYESIKSFSIYKLKKKGSLVVVIDQLVDSTALNEFHSLRVPIISFNSQTKMFDETSAIKVPAKVLPIKSDLSHLLFYSLLLKIFKSATNKKHKRYRLKKLYIKRRDLEMRKRNLLLKNARKRYGYRNQFGKPKKKFGKPEQRPMKVFSNAIHNTYSKKK